MSAVGSDSSLPVRLTDSRSRAGFSDSFWGVKRLAWQSQDRGAPRGPCWGSPALSLCVPVGGVRSRVGGIGLRVGSGVGDRGMEVGVIRVGGYKGVEPPYDSSTHLKSKSADLPGPHWTKCPAGCLESCRSPVIKRRGPRTYYVREAEFQF